MKWHYSIVAIDAMRNFQRVSGIEMMLFHSAGPWRCGMYGSHLSSAGTVWSWTLNCGSRQNHDSFTWQISSETNKRCRFCRSPRKFEMPLLFLSSPWYTTVTCYLVVVVEKEYSTLFTRASRNLHRSRLKQKPSKRQKPKHFVMNLGGKQSCKISVTTW